MCGWRFGGNNNNNIIIKKKIDLHGVRDHHDCIWSVFCTHTRVNIIHIAKRNLTIVYFRGEYLYGKYNGIGIINKRVSRVYNTVGTWCLYSCTRHFNNSSVSKFLFVQN